MSKSNFKSSLTMKSIPYVSLLALFVLSLFSTQMTAKAQTGGGVVEGRYSFSIEDGLTKSIEFNARGNSDGSATGRMTFSGPAEIPDQDVDGTGERGAGGSHANLYIEAEINGMVIERNRAVMSGVVTGSTIGEYIGQTVLLVVEDNGEGTNALDTLSWGLYKHAADGWVPADAELREDDGWQLRWVAKDAEREDDEGVQYERNPTISCQSFPLSSYAFIETRDGEGDIQIRQ